MIQSPTQNRKQITAREGQWFVVDAETGSGLERWGRYARRNLQLRADPVTFRGNSARIDGIAGAVRVANTPVEIVPKFLKSGDATWIDGFSSFLNYVGWAQASLSPAWTERRPLTRFVDATAAQFCNLLDRASRSGLPRSYFTRRLVGYSPDGPLNVAATLRNFAKLKPIFEWRNASLESNPDTVNVIRLALELLGRQCRDPLVRQHVERCLAQWPIAPVRAPNPPSLPRSFAHFAEVAELAYEICTGFGKAPGTDAIGFAYVIDMVKAFERSVEKALSTVASRVSNREFTATRQHRAVYAKPHGVQRKELVAIPDVVIHENGKPVVVVDAKYKSIVDQGNPADIGRPASVDFYQIITAAIAHRTDFALLIYPTPKAQLVEECSIDCWRVDLGPNEWLTIGSGAIEVIGLSGESTPDLMHDQLECMISKLVGSRDAR